MLLKKKTRLDFSRFDLGRGPWIRCTVLTFPPLIGWMLIRFRCVDITQLYLRSTCTGASGLVYWNVVVRPTLMGTKNVYENGPNPFFFFLFFQSYGNENGPDSYSQIRLSVS